MLLKIVMIFMLVAIRSAIAGLCNRMMNANGIGDGCADAGCGSTGGTCYDDPYYKLCLCYLSEQNRILDQP